MPADADAPPDLRHALDGEAGGFRRARHALQDRRPAAVSGSSRSRSGNVLASWLGSARPAYLSGGATFAIATARCASVVDAVAGNIVGRHDRLLSADEDAQADIVAFGALGSPRPSLRAPRSIATRRAWRSRRRRRRRRGARPRPAVRRVWSGRIGRGVSPWCLGLFRDGGRNWQAAPEMGSSMVASQAADAGCNRRWDVPRLMEMARQQSPDRDVEQQGKRMKRRDFLVALGGAAATATWPMRANARRRRHCGRNGWCASSCHIPLAVRPTCWRALSRNSSRINSASLS